MRTFTETDLSETIVSAGGPPETDLDPTAFLDTPFSDLGYDSLALLETAGLLRSRWGVDLPDDVLYRAGTPRELFDLVDRALRESGDRAG